MTDDEILKVAMEFNCYAISGYPLPLAATWNKRTVAFARRIAEMERAACGKVCDGLRDEYISLGMLIPCNAAMQCAAAIRARGTNHGQH